MRAAVAAPVVAGGLHRIDRVDDDRVAEAEVVLGEIASGQISLRSRYREALVPHGLLDRVDAQMHCADAPSE